MFASSLAPSLRKTPGALPAVHAVAAAALFRACGSPQDEVVAKTFECGAHGRRFEITYGVLDDPAVHSKYMGEPGVAVECRIRGRTDAYEVYKSLSEYPDRSASRTSQRSAASQSGIGAPPCRMQGVRTKACQGHVGQKQRRRLPWRRPNPPGRRRFSRAPVSLVVEREASPPPLSLIAWQAPAGAPSPDIRIGS